MLWCHDGVAVWCSGKEQLQSQFEHVNFHEGLVCLLNIAVACGAVEWPLTHAACPPPLPTHTHDTQSFLYASSVCCSPPQHTGLEGQQHIQRYIFKGHNFFSFKLSFSVMTGVDLYDPCNVGCMPWLKQHFQLLVFPIVQTTLHCCHAYSYSETVHTLFLNGNNAYISLHYAISMGFLVA